MQKLAYAFISAALLLTFAAVGLGALRLHHAATTERQTIRTQELQTAVLEGKRSDVVAAFRNVATHDAGEGRRLDAAYVAYLATPRKAAMFNRKIEAELSRQAGEIHRINPSARFALIVAAVGAGLLVVLLIWLFELERRSGRIDRDNAARSEELIRLRDEFVAVVSHELRTPLTSIIGYLELIADGDAGGLTSEQASYLAVVQRSTNRLVDLVGDLLLVAEAERGPLALELVEVDGAALAANAVESARPVADARGIIVRLEHGDPVTLAGDPTRLAQMLDNLISNAIKFTPQGGRVTVRAGRGGSDAVFEITDTGGGIAEDDRERLFDPFFRSHEANVRAVPGTGLGLTITKAIVDAHRGTIDVQSTRDGTTFRVSLPVGERVAALVR
ncbi:MAG TPA: HAMP domain-containing sensor histidine kinase [Gaiellaceae bacterium]|nr:HAMP domain-containing sensor histidine kinase [Gaiellaceae bacterium]